VVEGGGTKNPENTTTVNKRIISFLRALALSSFVAINTQIFLVIKNLNLCSRMDNIEPYIQNAINLELENYLEILCVKWGRPLSNVKSIFLISSMQIIKSGTKVVLSSKFLEKGYRFIFVFFSSKRKYTQNSQHFRHIYKKDYEVSFLKMWIVLKK